MFESSDAGFTREPLEVRYPFLDLRLVEFVLALPPSPLLPDKKLERAAMAGRLPQAILERQKRPFAGDAGAEAMRNGGYNILNEWNWSGPISQYVDVEALPRKIWESVFRKRKFLYARALLQLLVAVLARSSL